MNRDIDVAFMPLMPRLRGRAAIDAGPSGDRPATHDDPLHTIERELVLAEAAFRSERYRSALRHYSRARASIFALVHEDVDPGELAESFQGTRLPSSVELQEDLLDAAARQLSGLLKSRGSASPQTSRNPRSKLPDPLVPFGSTGVRFDRRGRATTIGLRLGTRLVTLESPSGVDIDRQRLQAALYAGRIRVRDVAELQLDATTPEALAASLPHLYAFALPVRMGDCRHRQGQFEPAEALYLQATEYGHLNPTLEADLIWRRLAANALAWGDALYRAGRRDEANARYVLLVTPQGEPPPSFLYESRALTHPAGIARELLARLGDIEITRRRGEVARILILSFSRLRQIAAGLDFDGLPLTPIHTYEHLRSLALGSAAEAVHAEREFVTFKMREEGESAARLDLERAVAAAQAEADLRAHLLDAAREDLDAAGAARDLADERRIHAISQRREYAELSTKQIWSQAASQAVAMGVDAIYSEISALADKIANCEKVDGEPGVLAAAYTLASGRRNREYELAKMDDAIAELGLAVDMAKEQAAAAKARYDAARAAHSAALAQLELAMSALEAFDAELFNPEAWNKMAGVMQSIARAYLQRAVEVAELMQRAYNFEHDTNLRRIQSSYGLRIVEGPGRGASDPKLFGGDLLKADIDAFGHHAVTTVTAKTSRIKDVISLSNDFPAQFESFLRTGTLTFETDLYEFDQLHPGFYAQRIYAVEIQLLGRLPQGGPRGTLQSGGVSYFRRRNGETARRIHGMDTLALSDLDVRGDALFQRATTGVRELFDGFGVGTTWILRLPRRSNDFDFRRILDVQLHLHYTARFDDLLAKSVLSAPVRRGDDVRLRNFRLRFDFPDTWYAFYQVGRASFMLDRYRLPLNQQDFALRSLHLRVEPRPGTTVSRTRLRVRGPADAGGEVTTTSDGIASTDDTPGLGSLVGIDPLGAWSIEVLDPSSYEHIHNIHLGLEYSFQYASELP